MSLGTAIDRQEVFCDTVNAPISIAWDKVFLIKKHMEFRTTVSRRQNSKSFITMSRQEDQMTHSDRTLKHKAKGSIATAQNRVGCEVLMGGLCYSARFNRRK
ncbi:unnamed protein product [Schistosoma curassoni]|uniref:Transposase n=1 Tax=Schistosoma curassoni TaxID=6186 RepID=A0A183JRF5_9TREM|nr:unnamed protein product [Schistosoma curassoni]